MAKYEKNGELTYVDDQGNEYVLLPKTKIENVDALQESLDKKLPIDGGTMSGAIAMGGNKITGLGTPTDAADAVPKAYADDLFGGVFNKTVYTGDFRKAPGGTWFTRVSEGGCSNYPPNAQYGYLTAYDTDVSRLLIYSEFDTKKIYTCNNANGWNDWTRVDGIGAAPGGFGLGGDGKFITDCNGQNASGFYEWDAGCANSPWDWGTMLVLGRHSGCTQVAFGEDGAARDEIAIRSISTGTSSWKKLPMIDVVWENEKNTSSFAAQTAPCDLSRYDWIGIVCIFDVNGVRRLPLFMCQANTTTGGFISGINPEDNTIVGRTVTSVNSSGVTFADAYKNGNSDNKVCIPYRILGFKGVY